VYRILSAGVPLVLLVAGSIWAYSNQEAISAALNPPAENRGAKLFDSIFGLRSSEHGPRGTESRFNDYEAARHEAERIQRDLDYRMADTHREIGRAMDRIEGLNGP
jgi:hypothetical protein